MWFSSNKQKDNSKNYNVKCRHCGKMMPSTVITGFCPYCNARLSVSETQQLGAQFTRHREDYFQLISGGKCIVHTLPFAVHCPARPNPICGALELRSNESIEDAYSQLKQLFCTSAFSWQLPTEYRTDPQFTIENWSQVGELWGEGAKPYAFVCELKELPLKISVKPGKHRPIKRPFLTLYGCPAPRCNAPLDKKVELIRYD